MDNSVQILVEAKNEYTAQLKKILTPRLYEGFKSIYDDIINISNQELQEKNVQTSSVIKTFQKTLKEIPQWNNEMIKNENNRIEKISNCDYLENLIEAVFITNTKILTSVQINKSKSMNVKVSIPSQSHFIHKCYMESAKEFYKNPYVFDQSKLLTPKEKHTNLREALSLIDLSINNAISNLLPIKDILKQGLTKMNSKVEEEESEESTENSNSSLSNDEEESEETSSSDEDNENNENNSKSEEDTNEETDENTNEDSDATTESEIEKSKDSIKLIKEDSNEENQKDNLKESSEDESKEIIIDNNYVPKEENEELTTDKIKLISKYPVPVNLNSNHSNHLDNKPIEEYKNIDIYKPSTSNFQKITGIQKIESHGESQVKPNVIHTEEKAETIEYMIPPIKKEINEKTVSNNNPFLRSIKHSKFIKNKTFGGGNNKKSSFYKKKYEENSANYNSLTETAKDTTLTTTSLQDTINEIKNTQNSLKIIKNKIMLKEASSDEESEKELEL